MKKLSESIGKKPSDSETGGTQALNELLKRKGTLGVRPISLGEISSKFYHPMPDEPHQVGSGISISSVNNDDMRN